MCFNSKTFQLQGDANDNDKQCPAKRLMRLSEGHVLGAGFVAAPLVLLHHLSGEDPVRTPASADPIRKRPNVILCYTLTLIGGEYG